MLTKKTQPLPSADGLNDAGGIVETERRTLPFLAHDAEAPSLDAQLMADLFHLTRARPKVPSEIDRIDANGFRSPVIHNAFWVPGKVPSLNELLDAKGGVPAKKRSIIMRHLPAKGKARQVHYHAYNDLKQSWKQRTIKALGTPFVRVSAAFFGYCVVEQAKTRDPSNICSSAIKFIEDGIVEAGVMGDDGWQNVLGIRVHWIHRPQRDPGIYVVMSSAPLLEEELEREYEEDHLQRVF